MTEKSAQMGELLAHLKIQEYLYHSFRMVFLFVETGLLICGVIVAQAGGAPGFLWVICAVAVVIAGGMLPNIVHRGQVVYFFQSLILELEQGGQVAAPFQSLKRFQDAHGLRVTPPEKLWRDAFKARAEYQKVAGGIGVSRVVLDGVIPAGLALIWLVLLVDFG